MFSIAYTLIQPLPDPFGSNAEPALTITNTANASPGINAVIGVGQTAKALGMAEMTLR
jgi:hypothetical protein